MRSALLALALLAAGCVSPDLLDPAAVDAADAPRATREETARAEGEWVAQARGASWVGLSGGWPRLDAPETFLAADLTVSWTAAHQQGDMVFQLFEPGDPTPRIEVALTRSPTTLAFGPDDARLVGGGNVRVFPGQEGATVKMAFAVDARYLVAAG